MYLEIELPTVVTTGRKDSQKSDANGATVTVTGVLLGNVDEVVMAGKADLLPYRRSPVLVIMT